MFEIYDSYYHMGLFTKDDIALFVEVGDLTQDQADKILKPATETVAQGQAINTYSPEKDTLHKKSPEFSTFKMLNLGFSYGRVLKGIWKVR